MKRLQVMVPNLSQLINMSPGFEKKGLSERKVDLLALCEFGCRYCSSNMGNYLRIRRESLAGLTEQQLGTRYYPDAEPGLTFHYPDVVRQLELELSRKSASFGRGETLMFSMLTDGFSPSLVTAGVTRAALDLLVQSTEFRIRVLTKNAVVGSPKWIEYFSKHRDRFIVGLSTGTLNDAWARRVEMGTSLPTARLRALRRLQDAGVPTYAMLCPVFADVLIAQDLERLVDQIRPGKCEHVWAEPYNDRTNWRHVRDGYERRTFGYEWMSDVFERHDQSRWSEYALELYARLRAKADSEGWIEKLRFLLYEHDVADEHVSRLDNLRGILLQSKPTPDGLSAHPGFARIQRYLSPSK